MMPTPPISIEKATALIDAVEDALREGYPSFGWGVVKGKKGAIYEGCRRVGLVVSGAPDAVKRAEKRAERKIDWSLFVPPARASDRDRARRGQVELHHSPPDGMDIASVSTTYDANGEVRSQSVRSVLAAGDPFAVPAGHIVTGVSAYVDAEGNELRRWVKTRDDGTAQLVDALRAAFEDMRGGAPAIAAPAYADHDLLAVYPLPDLHVGMYAWGEEAGEDYDVDIAVANALAGVAALVAQSPPARQAVILGLGDYFHQNDQSNATPRGNNRLDVDGRWQRVFTAGAKLVTRIVELVAARHAEVQVVFLEGNHDPDAAKCLRVALGMFYDGHERVSVWEGAALSWYHRFGSVLLGATHGHTMKPDRMAMMLAADRPEDWGRSRFRHFFFGHIHHDSAREVGGVKVESFGTPAAKDAYSAAAGYRSMRQMQALTFHRLMGPVGRHYWTVTPGKIRVKARAA
jgi:predicted phosphodiesterase